MRIDVLKSKIHRIKVTQAELHYVGSITLDVNLMEAAHLVENEKVQILNINNGERFETYVIKGERSTGQVCINGPAARKTQIGDVIIIISYCSIKAKKISKHQPFLVFPDANNTLVQ